jgi:hypothetical protein
MMTENDKQYGEKDSTSDQGIEFRSTIRFPKKDYEFMQWLIKEGEYTNITDIVRDAVKRFRLDWGDREAARNFMPMGPMMGMRMSGMNMMMRRMHGDDPEDRPR